MDDGSKIETYKAGLRLLHASDVTGLKQKIVALMNGAASDEVVITSHNFGDGGSAGQLVLEPMAKLNAMLAVLAELDATAAATLQSPGKVRYADFSCMPSLT